VEMGGVPCFIMMMRDITERQRSQREMEEQREQLTHLSRVAMLGELSGALAHELSQPLMSILSNAQAARRMLVREPVDLDEIREIIDDVIASDQRAGDVIRGLRAMLKRGESNRTRVVVNEVVHDVLKLAHGDLVSRRVDVLTHLDDALPAVSGDSVQLRQVLLNLIVNACEAMTDNSPGDRVLVIDTVGAAGEAVEVAIRDNGCGIPDDIRNGVFKPFVTTKRQGLGLGLSICRSIVEAHGGKLWCDSNHAGRGTAFHLRLPAESRLAPPAA
jgi:C4-dicarboxylate-specific signal transduction histidine kinase